jgi:hypothetical protein
MTWFFPIKLLFTKKKTSLWKLFALCENFYRTSDAFRQQIAMPPQKARRNSTTRSVTVVIWADHAVEGSRTEFVIASFHETSVKARKHLLNQLCDFLNRGLGQSFSLRACLLVE